MSYPIIITTLLSTILWHRHFCLTLNKHRLYPYQATVSVYEVKKLQTNVTLVAPLFELNRILINNAVFSLSCQYVLT